MRITIGSFTLDGAPASSTVTSAAFRLDMERPFVPVVRGNELRIDGLRAYVETANEAALKTAIDTIRAAFDTANGQAFTYYNTTGTPLFAISTSDWPELEVEYEIDHGDVNAVVVFSVVARRPAPPTGGGGITGIRGEVEWEFEIGPNRLTGATATAEFGPTTGMTAEDNAAAWVGGFYANPPTGLPTFFQSRLRPVIAVPRAIQKPVSTPEYDPFIVSVLFREVYRGLGNIPAGCTDFNVNVDMVNDAPLDLRSTESEGPAVLVLHGWFTLATENPDAFLSGQTVIDRSQMLSKASEIYEAIEGDFRTVYADVGTLHELGDVELPIGLDSGRVTFRRVFRTTEIISWRETTTLREQADLVINRDYRGKDLAHEGEGGDFLTLTHSMAVEALKVVAYRPPTLSSDWKRIDKSEDEVVRARLRGGVITYVTSGSSVWRYLNKGKKQTGGQTTSGSTGPQIPGHTGQFG